MESAVLVLALYAACCVLIHLVCSGIFHRRKYREGKPPVFPVPGKRRLFLLLSLSWGLPTTLLGAAAAGILFCAGHRPVRYGWVRAFFLPGIDWGLELGLFFIAPESGRLRICDHEFGHALQNCVLGPFNLGVVTVPSVLRFWYRRLRERSHKPLRTAYDAAWFEGTATASGELASSKIRRETPELFEGSRPVRRRKKLR
ncbi:MAG: hypothetical protein II719_02880 [Clostridia bacterium]|nr:hypothetical protein [Clostridia bacterium]